MRIQVGLGLVVGGLLFFRFLLFGLEVSSVGLVGMILRLRPVLAGFSFHFGWVNEYILDELKLYKAEG
jgi:hypothetical protein